MTALAAGDRSEFRAVFEALWPILQRFCRRALGDEEKAKDAAQDALMKLFLHSGTFDPKRDAISWALGFATFECLTARNRGARRREDGEELLGRIYALGATPEEAAIQRDLRQAAIEALGGLRASDAEAIEAALMGRRPSESRVAAIAFRKRLQRALERLRMIWRSRHGID
jgi:RNA polymerase sigma factor (sigma-70 family)